MERLVFKQMSARLDISHGERGNDIVATFEVQGASYPWLESEVIPGARAANVYLKIDRLTERKREGLLKCSSEVEPVFGSIACAERLDYEGESLGRAVYLSYHLPDTEFDLL